MWIPSSFREEDVPTLHDLIRAHPFGLLVSADGQRIHGTHLPFMIEPSPPNGVLVGHLARANPQWKSWTADTEVMAVFSGPHAYVSPGWYEDRVTVPTWNYAVVHAYGRPRVITETAELREAVRRLTELYEPVTGGWDPDEAEPIMATQLQAIVGFRIEIDRLEGKFKFNQNRSGSDREGVARALGQSDDPEDGRVAAIMRDQLRATSASPTGRANPGPDVEPPSGPTSNTYEPR